MERLRIVGGDKFDSSDLVEVKKDGICEDCGYTGKVWFIESDDAVGLCDHCLKFNYRTNKIIYEGKEYPKCGMILKIVRRNEGFEVLNKQLILYRNFNASETYWNSFGSGPGTSSALFGKLETAKEFIRYLDDNNPDFDEAQDWIENHN